VPNVWPPRDDVDLADVVRADELRGHLTRESSLGFSIDEHRVAPP
jgi:hypothetical protein